MLVGSSCEFEGKIFGIKGWFSSNSDGDESMLNKSLSLASELV